MCFRARHAGLRPGYAPCSEVLKLRLGLLSRRARSSVGRAVVLYTTGPWFDPMRAHLYTKDSLSFLTVTAGPTECAGLLLCTCRRYTILNLLFISLRMSPRTKRAIGIVLLFLPMVLIPVLVLYAISTFVSSMLSETIYNGAGVGALIRTMLGVVGLLGVASIIATPFGLYLAARYSQGFSIGQAWHAGWEGTKRHFWVFLGLAALFVIAMAAPDVLEEMGAPESAGFLWNVALLLVCILLAPGFLRYTIMAARGEHPAVSVFWGSIHRAATLLGGAILFDLIVLGGLILFIVPGIIWAFKYQLAPYFIVDKNMGVFEALKASGHATSGAKWDLFTWFVLTQIAMLLGAIPFLLGWLIIIPIALIGRAHIYLQLSGGAAVPMQQPPAAGPMTSVPPQAYL